MFEYAHKTAIVGIGQTEFSKESGRSQLQLAAEASLAAIEDAGLTPADIDGMVAYTVEDNEEHDLIAALGIPGLSWSVRVPSGGGGAGATVFLAAGAIASGAAKNVLLFRAFNERSGRRFGRAMNPQGLSVGRWNGSGFNSVLWSIPYGVMTPSALISSANLEYMRKYGVTNEDLGHFAVASREYAATNPAAWYYGRPMSLEEHQESPWFVEPVIRRRDCCQESDGGVAIVMTSVDRAKDLKQTPVVVKGAAQDIRPSGHVGLSGRTEVVADRLYRGAGLGPSDINAAMLYDAFTVEVFPTIEGYGFCKPGEAKDFVRGGETRIGGQTPINMNGGHQGEAYIHGMNLITEAVRQVRGTAANQVADVEHVLFGTQVSAHILGRL